MYCAVTFTLIVLFVHYVSPGSNKAPEYPEILQGNCSEAKDSEMVYHEIVDKSEIPLMSRNETCTWYGDEKLYCIKVLNEYNKQYGKGGGTVFVKHGGLGHYFVTLEMHTQKGGAMKFLIFLYGKKTK